ncbi:Por secretion system C-terminal sorting domain-containing protein [Pustulibacterium marinum]|uniref:Por secretion system C-terminal sorting domain-containing protein n=1 Tax=Pustulibacterium marinum TaxID=1224947 RepID=A0A1I7EVF1_9FLAO|nr:T9SS type A sorting domain-containing protein [Pustulibacterium marinum]SFU27901.1 Por secretion system C-terminal sorting domain-containing protein [Pustulibacterium marinum]
MKKSYTGNFIVFLMLMIGGNAFAQELTYEIPLEEMVSNSDEIVEGSVIRKQSFWDQGKANIYTLNTVEVYKVFKGISVDTITVVTLGGAVDLQAQEVHPSLQLETDELGLFILKSNDVTFETPSDYPTFSSYSASQAFFQYDLTNDEVLNPYHSFSSITNDFYNEIKGFTGKAYQDVKRVRIASSIAHQKAQKVWNTSAITGFTPTSASAGTHTLLTISGTGFGTETGTVQFRNSDTGGTTYTSALDSQVITWTDSEIQVEIPAQAGTGNIRVVTSSSSNLVSSENIIITYAESNVQYNPSTELIAFQTQHVNDNFLGGYTWQMYTDFADNTAANNAFMRAFNSWVCGTEINWTVGANTIVNQIAADGVNVIRFDVGSELPNGVLGRCTSRYAGCFIDFASMSWYVSELDIVFDAAINWNYAEEDPSFSQYDFESVAVHELGHGHQLLHVIDSNAIMHYSITNGETKRDLSIDDIAGGTDVQARSTTTAPCTQTSATTLDCPTAVLTDMISENIRLYPNPVKENLMVENPAGIQFSEISVYDMRGRKVVTFESSATFIEIPMINLKRGVYLLKFVSKQINSSYKILKE